MVRGEPFLIGCPGTNSDNGKCFRTRNSKARYIPGPVSCHEVADQVTGAPRLDATTIAHGRLGEAVEEGSGAVYVIDGLGVKGRAEHRHAG